MNLSALTLGLVVTEPVLKERSAAAVSLISMKSNDATTYFSGAGHKALNLKPSLAWTIASSLVKASTAPLLAVYASWGVAAPTRATTEAVLMMEPFVFLCLRRDRTACLQPNHTPLTLMLCVRSQIFSGVSMASLVCQSLHPTFATEQRLTSVISMHNTCIVEDDINTAPGVNVLHHGSNLRFLAHIARLHFELAGGVGDDLLEL